MRDAVPIASVEAALMLDGETGFIKINRFAATTHQEFITALRGLQKRGLKSLVLDLRENPGGFLDQAVAIADEFLDGDKTIVVTGAVLNPAPMPPSSRACSSRASWRCWWMKARRPRPKC